MPHLLTLDRPTITAFFVDFFGLMRALACSPVPVCAALTGHSPAGGTVLAIFCDYRVMAAANPAKPDKPFLVGLNEVQVGLAVPPAIHGALRRLVGPRTAERLAVEGPLIPAAEAHRLGLVDELAPADAVIERALAWCRSLLALPRQAMLATRELARADLAAAFAGVDGQTERWADAWFSDETQGAMRALVSRLKR